MSELSRLVRRKRIESGMTQDQLGKKVGLTLAAVYNIENGASKATNSVRIIAKELKINTDELLKVIAADYIDNLKTKWEL